MTNQYAVPCNQSDTRECRTLPLTLPLLPTTAQVSNFIDTSSSGSAPSIMAAQKHQFIVRDWLVLSVIILVISFFCRLVSEWFWNSFSRLSFSISRVLSPYEKEENDAFSEVFFEMGRYLFFTKSNGKAP
jgi:hypothetical protein